MKEAVIRGMKLLIGEKADVYIEEELMKTKKLVVIVALAMAVALAFSGCTLLMGKDGKAYLTVTSSYSWYAYTQSGLGFPSTWYGNTAYAVNPGTWNYYYTQAYYYGYYSIYANPYLYDVNADVSYYWAEPYYVSEATAAYDAFTSGGYYYSSSITIATNPAKEVKIVYATGRAKLYEVFDGIPSRRRQEDAGRQRTER